MDINDLRAVLTAICLIAFLLIVYWAYSGKNKARFDEASRLPFADEKGDVHPRYARSGSKLNGDL